MEENKIVTNQKLLNLACGAKVASIGNWSNVDFFSPVAGVLQMDILKGLNFQNDTFDVVYTAQFMEHLTLEQASKVLKEINRVLKPGGTLRVVTPDLEEMTESYLAALKSLKSQSNAFLEKQYEWLRLEIFDQGLRDYTGGGMLEYIGEVDQEMDKYLTERIGHTYVSSVNSINASPNAMTIKDVIKKLPKVPQKIKGLVTSLFTSSDAKVGKFRRSGELHLYVHDLFSLTRMLDKAGYIEITREDAYSSTIANWGNYNLDVVDGAVDAPVSLYVEAKKLL